MRQLTEATKEQNMKLTNRRIVIISLTALLITSTGAVMAFGGQCDRAGARPPMPPISQLTDLTDEQKSQLREIRKEARGAMRSLRDDLHDNRADLRDAMIDNADLQTVRKLAEKQGDQVTRMIVLRAEIRNKVNSVLTAEQREELESLRGSGGGMGRHGKMMRFY
jgi:Spy/CpxP family protein refolding chaperone